jgi:glycosyltransferase involved in cell wall biosynthesis
VRLAILAPSPYNFVMGGAEHFLSGLQHYINEETLHVCEVIKVPTKEDTLLELVRAYRQHAQYDLLGYDRVMTSKYPAWMVNHPNHALYMLHTLRGLYDTYHFMRQPLDPAWDEGNRWIRAETDRFRRARPDDNKAALQLLDIVETAIETGKLVASFVQHPGPFARHVIHELDRFALQPARIRSYATMSQTVARRAGYFPPGVEANVVHPPPRLRAFRCGGDDYLFTVSRLDGPKRVGLLIEAMRHVKTDIPLLIGGTGPEEARLRDMAAGDPRIRFLGQLTDETLLDHYANCLAVAFVPYDEDYGLITIEAMRSGKPVLTVNDAGGVTEFVRHGETGLCVTPDAATLGAAIDELCSNRAQAREMGRRARQSVAGISWRPVAEEALGVQLPEPKIINLPAPKLTSKTRRKAVVAVTFGITPPRGGGQSRIFHLYKTMAQRMDIVLVCLCNCDELPSRTEIAPGLWEVRVPKSLEHQELENAASSTVDNVPITDIVASREIKHTPAFIQQLEQEGADADVAIVSHPFFASLVRRLFPSLPMWMEAQDVELTLKRDILPKTTAAEALLNLVAQEERMAWQASEVVYTCAKRDLETLTSLYGPTQAECLVVPNGFAEEEVTFTPKEERHRLKARLGLNGRPMVIFIGSWHGPNLEACKLILSAAPSLPHVTFAIVGSAGLYFKGQTVPENVHLVGPVDEAEKQVFLAAADVALNPMTSGSGSNLKMLDYFAAGVPVIATEFGARGIDAEPGVHYISANPEMLVQTLVMFLVGATDLDSMVVRANELARSHYSWSAIGASALRKLEPFLA